MNLKLKDLIDFFQSSTFSVYVILNFPDGYMNILRFRIDLITLDKTEVKLHNCPKGKSFNTILQKKLKNFPNSLSNLQSFISMMWD